MPLLMTVLSLLIGQAAAPAPLANLLLSPKALADLLPANAAVVLHVGDKASYDAGHVPGAQLFEVREISEAGGTLRTQMLPIDGLRAAFEAHGVTDSNRIVLYSARGSQPQSTARVFVALDLLGLADRTFVLDGGLDAWRAEGGLLSTESSKVSPGRFTPRPRADVIVDVTYVKAHLTDPRVSVVDARTRPYYTGEDTRGFPRPGHIPGAVNLPFDSLSQTGDAPVLKDLATLKSMFAEAGVKPDTEVVAYCHIGLQASQVYMAGRMLGLRVKLYDGSFEEWSAKEELPVEKGIKK
jgi:thiosulfate/3-mercaptopyruvate sulfurtransferase